MRIRTASDVAYTGIAWFPILAVAVAVAWVMASGLLQLEMISFGSEYLVGNHETTNMPTPLGGASDAEMLTAALESGDTERMAAALDQLEAQRAPLPDSGSGR